MKRAILTFTLMYLALFVRPVSAQITYLEQSDYLIFGPANIKGDKKMAHAYYTRLYKDLVFDIQREIKELKAYILVIQDKKWNAYTRKNRTIKAEIKIAYLKEEQALVEEYIDYWWERNNDNLPSSLEAVDLSCCYSLKLEDGQRLMPEEFEVEHLATDGMRFSEVIQPNSMRRKRRLLKVKKANCKSERPEDCIKWKIEELPSDSDRNDIIGRVSRDYIPDDFVRLGGFYEREIEIEQMNNILLVTNFFLNGEMEALQVESVDRISCE